MVSNILVVAVHPDDETLGCGGTLLKNKSYGSKIHWLICTATQNHKFESIRLKEIEKVADVYKFDSVHHLKLNAMHVDEYATADIVSKISNTVNLVKPDTIYLPFKLDPHSDHRKIFDAAYSCTKVFRYPFLKKIYMMEVLSETEFSSAVGGEGFVPNVFVDVSEFMDKKIEIMKFYSSEIGEHPFPRSEVSIKALATLRGSTAGCGYAESFMLVKEIG